MRKQLSNSEIIFLIDKLRKEYHDALKGIDIDERKKITDNIDIIRKEHSIDETVVIMYPEVYRTLSDKVKLSYVKNNDR